MRDERTRDAVDDLWASTVADPEAGLATLFVADNRRRRHRRASLAAAAAVAIVAAWWGGSSVGGPPESARDSGQVTSDPSQGPGHDAPPECQLYGVSCLGGRTYQMQLEVPLQWHIPRGYGVASGGGVSNHLVESYGDSGTAGVTVIEDAHAASVTSAAAGGVPATARGFTHWLASRPALDSSVPRRTTFDGRDAWRVRVSLRPGVDAGPGSCGGSNPCYPVTFDSGFITGIWNGMVAEYTAFDLPGAGTTVVWSWSFDQGRAPLARNRAVVEGLTWNLD